MPKLKIRLLRRNDIEACASIVTANYTSHYGKLAAVEIGEMFGSSSIRPVYLVAEQGKEVVGFAGFMQSWMDYHVYTIFWVNVRPDKQGKGIGGRLVQKVIRILRKKKGASYVMLTTKSPRFYGKNFGFKTLAVLPQRAGGRSRLMGLSLS